MSRKSELQRKLESLPAPKPPANLAERIKSEIPKDLRFSVEDERERFSSSIALNLRVAASILVLVSAAYLAIHVMTRSAKDPMAASRTAVRQVQPAIATSSDTAALSVAVAEAEPLPVAPERKQVVKKMKPASVVAELDRKEEEQIVEAPKGATGGVRANEPSAALDAMQTAPAAAPVPPPPAAPAVAKMAAADESQAAPQAQSRTANAKSAAESKNMLAFRDDAGRAKDESPVQRFASPGALPNAPVLDVEAAEEPIAPGRVVARVSFDSGVAVKDLWIDTLLGDDAAPSARWIAGSYRWGASEWTNRSRTVLVEFAVPAGSDAPLVTIRARYRVGDDPIMQSVEKIVRRSDVRAWSVASRRMKSATLAALWQHGANPSEVAAAAKAAGLDELVKAIENR